MSVSGQILMNTSKAFHREADACLLKVSGLGGKALLLGKLSWEGFYFWIQSGLLVPCAVF